MPGMGNHHHAIVTTSGEAQQYFDQGVNLVFGFNHEEAVRSFQRAAELDPKAAMPHWGIAWALGPNYNLDVDDDRAKQANAAIAQALMLSTADSEIERAYIEAMAIRFPTDAKPDRAALARKYSDAMRDLSQQYPDDLDAATLYAESLMNLRAWKLWSLDGKPAERTEEIVAVLESVLARDPNHLGANHYYIHTVEASPTPGRALPSATRLDRLAPAAGHLTHMPAHIYARVGDQAAAARANEAGARADREYFKIAPADSFYGLAYFTHNLHFLADSEMMRGRLASARRAADEVAEKMAPHTQMMPMVESLITMKTAVLLRFGRHEEILALPHAAGRIIRSRSRGGTSHAASHWLAPAKPTRQRKSGRRSPRRPRRFRLKRSSAARASRARRIVLALAAIVLDARIACGARVAGRCDPAVDERRRGRRQAPVRRAAGLLLSGARVARRCAASQRQGRRRRARVPRRSRTASAECPIAVRPPREPHQTRQERGCRVGQTRLRRGVEGRRHDADDRSAVSRSSVLSAVVFVLLATQKSN